MHSRRRDAISTRASRATTHTPNGPHLRRLGANSKLVGVGGGGGVDADEITRRRVARHCVRDRSSGAASAASSPFGGSVTCASHLRLVANAAAAAAARCDPHSARGAPTAKPAAD